MRFLVAVATRWRRLAAVLALVLVAGAVPACGGSGSGSGADRPAQFKVAFTPDPVDALYDGRSFWWRYEVSGENVTDAGLHLAGFYLDRGDGKWRWTNTNLPFPPGRRVRLAAESVKVDPARVQPGARSVHRYRFVVIDAEGQFEVPASVELRF